MNVTAIKALIRNDLRLYRADRRAVIVGILMPILIAAFFGYLFGQNNSDEEAGKVPVAVVDEDGSAITRAITSVVPPGAKPMTILMGLAGQACAYAAPAVPNRHKAAAARCITVRRGREKEILVIAFSIDFIGDCEFSQNNCSRHTIVLSFNLSLSFQKSI